VKEFSTSFWQIVPQDMDMKLLSDETMIGMILSLTCALICMTDSAASSPLVASVVMWIFSIDELFVSTKRGERGGRWSRVAAASLSVYLMDYSHKFIRRDALFAACTFIVVDGR